MLGKFRRGISIGIIIFVCKALHPLFDAREEVLSNFPTWIKLPNLPLEFKMEFGLNVIGELYDPYKGKEVY
jgi:hypothetical protein